MVSKCANPACEAPFRYLHEGRIFSVPSDSAEHSTNAIRRTVERYWLCSTCSDRMTLVLQSGKVILRPLTPIPEMGMKPVRSAVRAAKCVA